MSSFFGVVHLESRWDTDNLCKQGILRWSFYLLQMSPSMIFLCLSRNTFVVGPGQDQHDIFSPRCCICVTFFLISASIQLFYRPLCWLDLLLLFFIPQEKSNCLAVVNRESSAIKCTCTLQILVGWLMLKYHGSLFIFMIQMERRLLELNGNPWNNISFLLVELFWQSGATKVRYMYCGLFFSIWQYKCTCFGCYCTSTQFMFRDTWAWVKY